jgi:hypothetical protein
MKTSTRGGYTGAVSDPARGIRPPAVGDAAFDEYYYTHYGHTATDDYQTSDALRTFFRMVADRIVADIAPKTALDAGCAIGLLVGALRRHGVDATGVDVSSYAISKVDDALRPYCRHGSIADEFAGRYDLIVSIEVVEHMPPREAEAAIANFCRHTDDVLFSSTPFDYKELTHVNVHPPDYWAAEFARHGFYRDVDFDASYLTAWATRYRRSAEPLPRIVRNYERRYWEMAQERHDTRAHALQIQRELAERIQTFEQATADAKAARTQRDAAEVKLAQALDRIHHMERSLFWRARMALQRLRGRNS